MTGDSEPAGVVVKRFLYVNRRAPHGTIYAWEGLQTVLIGAAFGQDVSVLFLDDGVYQIKRDQDTAGVQMKNFSKAYRALEMYEVEKLYVAETSLRERGLASGDLLVPVEVLTTEAVASLMESQDVIVTF